jgi:hypothetical protein
MSDNTDTNAPVAETAQQTRDRIAAEVGALGVSGIVVYYSIIAFGWLGNAVEFFSIPWTRPMLAGLLLTGLALDRFAGSNDGVPPVVVGYSALALVVAGTSAGVLNMPLPDTTISGILLGLLASDYYLGG